MQVLLRQSQQTAAQVQVLARSHEMSSSSGSQTVNGLASAMATYAVAAAESEQQLVEAIAETHKVTGERLVGSHSLLTQEVKKIMESQERKQESREKLSSTSSSKPLMYLRHQPGRKTDRIGLSSGID